MYLGDSWYIHAFFMMFEHLVLQFVLIDVSTSC
jgi:hypothetical protein